MKLFNSLLSRSAENVFCRQRNEELIIFPQVYDMSVNVISLQFSSLDRPNRMFLKFEEKKEVVGCENDTFPFQDLPVICKLQVFSYLRTHEKGTSRRVCREWDSLLKLPSFWRNVDLDFLLAKPQQENKELLNSTESFFSCHHKKRLEAFVSFAESLEMKIKNLKFDLEICLGTDVLNCLLESNICHDVSAVEMTWFNIIIPSFHDMEQKTNDSKQDLNLHCRRKQRQMVVFLNNFVKLMPKIEKLIIPFCWTQGSIDALCSLINLKKLVLSKQSELKTLDQSSLDTTLNALTNLEELNVEICSPSVCGLQEFSIKSSSLKHLNTSRSKGVCFSCLKLPQLTHLTVSRTSYFCPLVILLHEGLAKKACLYSVLRSGAPNLRVLNGHLLSKCWRESSYPKLESVLADTCPCLVHNKNPQ